MKRCAKRSLIVLALVAGTASGLGAAGQSARLRRAPDFALPDYLGNTVSLKDFRGRIVLLEFFQSGCATCQEDAPVLEELYRKYKDRGVVVLGVSHDTGGAEVVKEFAKKYDITFPLLLGDLEIAVRYIGIGPEKPTFGIPRFFLIDREGYIARDIDVARERAFLSDAKGSLERAIEDLLGHPSVALRSTTPDSAPL